jgi:hypothetical protein
MGKCYNSTVINAQIEQVWETVKDFHDMSWGSPVIESVDVIGDLKGNETGAKRVLNGAFHETLLSVDDVNHQFSYSIDDGPGPVSKEAVSNYVGKVKLYPVTDNNLTFIEWESSFNSEDENEVSDFCNPIYSALLGALKEKFKV